MKFSVKAGKFAESIKPVVSIATKGIIKDFEYAGKATLDANSDELICSAYGGHLATSIKVLDNDADIEYECEKPGIATVNAVDFSNTLSSFPPSTQLTIEIDGTELKVSKTKDDEEYQTCPIYDSHIETPKAAKTGDKKIEIVRSILLDGIESVAFAIGFEKHKPQYLYYVVNAYPDSVRFVSGTGGRFAVKDFHGKACVTSDKDYRFFLPKEQTPVITEVLAYADTEENVTIIEAEVQSKPQIVFRAGKTEIVLVGIDPDVKYPDVDPLMKSKKTTIVVTKAEDWEYATKGLQATFNEEVKKMHSTHESDIILKLENKYILLESKSNMKASRKVPLTDIREKVDDDLRFHTTTMYVSEVFAKSDKEDNITVEFIDPKKPVFVRYPKKNNKALGFDSNFTLFFASLQG